MTWVSTADQPKTGGRCKRKKVRAWQKKGSMVVRFPNPWAVHVGGSSSRFFCRLEFQGVTMQTPRRVWIQAIKLRPQ